MAYNQSFWSSPSGRQCFGKQIKSPKGKYFSIFLVPLTPCLSLLLFPKERKLSDTQFFQIVDQEWSTRIAHHRDEKCVDTNQQSPGNLYWTLKLRYMPNTQFCSQQRHLSASLRSKSRFRLTERQSELHILQMGCYLFKS